MKTRCTRENSRTSVQRVESLNKIVAHATGTFCTKAAFSSHMSFFQCAGQDGDVCVQLQAVVLAQSMIPVSTLPKSKVTVRELSLCSSLAVVHPHAEDCAALGSGPERHVAVYMSLERVDAVIL